MNDPLYPYRVYLKARSGTWEYDIVVEAASKDDAYENVHDFMNLTMFKISKVEAL
jgi:hypothetical protein